uniref:Uncharacterized protein n=1 Tax=Panagrolaimus sp. PS1159 TaxID=55785 RepID=A0AC35F9T6_9BILA
MAATFLFTEIPKCSKPIYDDTDGLISSSQCSIDRYGSTSSSNNENSTDFPQRINLKNKKVFKNITKWMYEVNNRNPSNSFPVSYL